MVSNSLATPGYMLGMLGFAAVSAMYVGRWKISPYAQAFSWACAASAVWAGVHTLGTLGYIEQPGYIAAVELTRNVVWVLALFMIVRQIDDRRIADIAKRFGLLLLSLLVLLLGLYSYWRFGSLSSALIASSGIVLGVAVISLLEQLFRNLPSDSTSSLRYVCVALLVVTAFDIIVNVHAITVSGFDRDLAAARGYISALVILPLVLLGGRSSTEATIDTPRQAVFYGFSLLATGIVITVWLSADFYLSRYGGSVGELASIVLGAAAFWLLGTLLVSTTVRARMRVFLTKLFFRYKYDYRKEWLRFVGTLSESGLEHVPTTSVRAVAPIVNSPGGIVWIRDQDSNDYRPAGAWHCDLPAGQTVSAASSMVGFLRDRQWVIDFQELRADPSHYDGLHVDRWFAERDDFWLVVPMFIGKQLFGFIVLLRPTITPTLNFEDHDLLKTVGRHVGTHLKQAESEKRLAESSQFGAYHRLSAFLMHDMNNLIAQQSLVVKNAEKFRHDPRFVDDAIGTIAHSVTRMRRLMDQLSSNSAVPKQSRLNLRTVLETAVERNSSRKPVPTARLTSTDLHVHADRERLTLIIEHLIRNAQDATSDGGSIEVASQADGEMCIVTIKDTGCGMTQEFISQRLFRPFDSTKGSQGMGIGAYQAREYVRILGGRLDVQSEVGCGTSISLRIPVVP